MQHRYDYLFSSAMNIYKYLNIELTQLRHVIVGKEWCCTPHDNVNRLYITLDGEGALITESGTLTLQPYHIYLIPAKLPFSSQCDTYLEKLYVHFRVFILPNQDLLSELDHILEIDSSREEIEKLKEVLHSGDISAVLPFRLKLDQIILGAVQPFVEKYSDDLSIYLKFEKFFTYTTTHIYADLSIGDVCQNIGTTPRKLAYHYKKATGQSVKSYLNTILLNRIKFLLQTTDMSVRDISAELHFNNEFYCSRFFKNQGGISPREFRKTAI